MSTSAFILAAAVIGAAQPSEPDVQRPAALESPDDAAAPSEPAPPSDAAAPEATEPEATTPESPETAPAGEALPEEPPAATEPEPEPPIAEAPAEPEPAAATDVPAEGEVFTVASGAEGDGPPYYNEADEAALRERYNLESPSTEPPRQAKWRCLVADPTCGINFEVNATSAYAYRGRQGDVRGGNSNPRWHSGRAQYDLWLNLPVMVETLGRQKFTRMTLGPKGGVIFSDTGSLWGNLGIAARYWLGRGRFAPTIEFSSALSYRMGGRPTQGLGGEKPKFQMTRGPVGFTADVGVGLGGFGAIVLGGQYDSPLAREDLPEQFRVSAGGTFFVGFRGNIVWGAPAAAAALTHGMTQRYAAEP